MDSTNLNEKLKSVGVAQFMPKSLDGREAIRQESRRKNNVSTSGVNVRVL
jgi:hypothetical protein